MTIEHGLLSIAQVLEGDGRWSQGREDTESPLEGIVYAMVGICDPAQVPTATEASTVRKVTPFSLYAAKKYSHRCAPETYKPEVSKALRAASEYQVTKAFWEGDASILGTWSGEVSMASPDVTTVAADADPVVTLSNVLAKAYSDNPSLADPVLHLGYQSAMRLGAGLNNLGISWVVGQGYPETAIAVTGPITVHLGSIQTLESEARTPRNNRFVVEATRFASIEFDVALAVKATP